MARRYVCGGCFLLLCLFSASLRCSARCIALRACLGEKIPRPARFALPLAPLLRSLRSLLPSQRIITMQHGGGFTASLAAARPCRPSPCSSRQVPHAVLGVIASCGSLWERSLRLRVRSPPPLVRGERGSELGSCCLYRCFGKKEKPSGDGTPRALRRIARLHARSSSARGWSGLTSAAAEAPIVTGKRGTSGFPARHRITILPQPESFVKPKFSALCFSP